MNKVKIISRLLFYITRLLALVYFAMALHSIIALVTKWSLHFKDGEKYFQVSFPFSNTVYLVGDYNLPYIIFDFLMVLIFYGLFFLLVSNVFKVFFQPRLFTEYSIKHLKIFYLANLIIPVLAVLAAAIFTQVDKEVTVLILLHFILGIFAYFLAAIFKQGLNLQKEQDLII